MKTFPAEQRETAERIAVQLSIASVDGTLDTLGTIVHPNIIKAFCEAVVMMTNNGERK